MKKLTRVFWLALAGLQILFGAVALFGYFGSKSENKGLSFLLPQELPLVGYSSAEVSGKRVYAKMDRDAFNAHVKAVQGRNYLEAMIFAYDNRERELSDEVEGLLIWMLISGSMCFVIGMLTVLRSRNRSRITTLSDGPPVPLVQ